MGTNSGATTGINNKPVGAGGASGSSVVGGVVASGVVGVGGVGVGGVGNNSLSGAVGVGGIGVSNVNSAPGTGGIGTGSNGSEDSGNGGGGGSTGQNNQQTTPQYTIPGILHFIQHEWSRFELERSQWDVDRAELQVRTRRVYNSSIFFCHLYFFNDIYPKRLNACLSTSKFIFFISSIR